MSEAIKVVIKPKTIQILVEFCIEEKIEFNVRPQSFPDTDWEFNLLVKDIKTAVMTGMFLRENRIDIPGNDQPAKAAKKPVAKKTKEEEDKAAATQPEQPKNSEEDKGLF